MTERLIYTVEDLIEAINTCEAIVTNWSGRDVLLSREEALEIALEMDIEIDGDDDYLGRVDGNTLYL